MADLERRIGELEEQLRTGRIDLKRLPLTALKAKLTTDLRPDADTFLLPKSVGNDSLEDDAVDARVLGPVTSAVLTDFTSGTWTPTWTGSGSNPAIGNGVLTGTYVKHGTLVKIDLRVEPGLSTTFGTGSYLLTLPFAPASRRQLLTCDLLDAGTQHYLGVGIIGAAGSTTLEEILVASNAFGPGNWQHNSPFTFGNGDRFLLSGVYEAAA